MPSIDLGQGPFSEKRDVLLGERALEHGGVADVDFLEGTVLNEFHLTIRNR